MSEIIKAKKIRILTDATVEADMRLRSWHGEDKEDYAKRLENECRDFHDHCRDHRSLDHIRLTVNRTYLDCCSGCKRELETVNDPEMNEGRPSCAWCGAEIES